MYGNNVLTFVTTSVRSASAEVISALVSAGADVNSKNIYNSAVTPLSLVLLRGTAVSIEVWGNERNGESDYVFIFYLYQM